MKKMYFCAEKGCGPRGAVPAHSVVRPRKSAGHGGEKTAVEYNYNKNRPKMQLIAPPIFLPLRRHVAAICGLSAKENEGRAKRRALVHFPLKKGGAASGKATGGREMRLPAA